MPVTSPTTRIGWTLECCKCGRRVEFHRATTGFIHARVGYVVLTVEEPGFYFGKSGWFMTGECAYCPTCTLSLRASGAMFDLLP